MAFSDHPQFSAPAMLMRRSLHRGRMGHAYLLTGDSLEDLEAFSFSLAKALNCDNNANGFPEDADACDTCLSCRKIDHLNHADVHWVRPESKTRIISVDQVRHMMKTVSLKPTEARFKVISLVSADRLNVQAANAFLKTLEEPPENTVFLLLSTDTGRMLETIMSRCQRLHCGTGAVPVTDDTRAWLGEFAKMAASPNAGLFGRYRLLDQLLQRLSVIKSEVEQQLSERSPMEQYDDVDPKLLERWKDELSAGVEAEYRRRRGDTLLAIQLWFRDVWLTTQGASTPELETFGNLAEETEAVADRTGRVKATRNLEILEATQRLLFTNVQEALALEIGLLKLSL